jgi:hypothetical protein
LLSPEAGGVVCRSCLASRREATIPVTPGALAVLLRVLRPPAGQAGRLRVGAAAERELSRLLEAFVEARTGERLRCARALEALTGAR